MSDHSLSGNTISWSRVVVPLTGVDMVSSYRNGKGAKSLLLDKKYDPSYRSGNLIEDLSNHKKYLEALQDDVVEEPTGSPTVFSNKDVGHPFATYKIRCSQPQGWLKLTKIAGNLPWAYSDCSFVMGSQPIPLLTDPFGNLFSSGSFKQRFSYYTWPAGILSGYSVPSVPVAQQLVSQSLHQRLASGLIASTNPWKPRASLAVSVGELLTGDVPSITKNLRYYLSNIQSLKKTAGSEFLNVEFGWMPLISDIMKTVQTLFQLHLLLHTSNEKRRGRSGDLGIIGRVDTSTPSVTDSNPTIGSPLGWKLQSSSGTLTSPGSFSGVPGTWSRSFTVSADYRFSARYHHGVSASPTAMGYLDRAIELLGLKLTPDVLWQLTPWTWLLDWASDLGAISSNLTNLEMSNVLLDYAYLTYCVSTDTSMSVTTPGVWTVGSFRYEAPRFFTTRSTSIEKIREQASPFGFSVGWNGLTVNQLSILAALGMSRGR